MANSSAGGSGAWEIVFCTHATSCQAFFSDNPAHWPYRSPVPALSYIGARRDGLEVETQVVSIFHYRDGRQIERWFYPDDVIAWNSIFGG